MMMRKFVIALVLAIVGVLLTVVNAFAIPTCVAQGEYQQVEYDMRKVRVHEIFDGYPGEYSYYFQGATTEYDERYYDPCWLGSGNWVVIMYSKPIGSGFWRVQWKAIQ